MADILSEAAARAIGSFDTFIQQSQYVERPAGETPVADFCKAENFDAVSAIKLLLDPAPSYYGHKEVVFAALSAWVIAPKDLEARLHFVAMEIKVLLSNAEAKAEAFHEGLAIRADFIARYIVAGHQFVEQIYYGMGGAELLYDHGNPNEMGFYFDGEKSTAYTLRKMMACCHWLATQPQPNKKKTPSVNRAISMVSSFADHNISSRSAIYAQWAAWRDNIALIYAASTISLDEGSLLDWFLDGAPSYERQAAHFSLWLGRARYVCEKILSAMPQDERIYAENVKALTVIEPIAFDCPFFSDDELNRLSTMK